MMILKDTFVLVPDEPGIFRSGKLGIGPTSGNPGEATSTVMVALATAFKPLAKAVTLTVFVVVLFRLAVQV